MNSRDKGNSFEIQVAKAFTARFGFKFRRTPLSGGWSEKKDAKGDIICIDRDDFLYCVECKNAEGWTLESLFTTRHQWFDDWWLQATTKCPDSKIPLLVFTRNFCPAFVVMKSRDFIKCTEINDYTALLHTEVRMTTIPKLDIMLSRFDELLQALKWFIDANQA